MAPPLPRGQGSQARAVPLGPTTVFLTEDIVFGCLLYKHHPPGCLARGPAQKLKGKIIFLSPCGSVWGRSLRVAGAGGQPWELGILLGSAPCHSWGVLAGAVLAGEGPSCREPSFVLICYLVVLIKHILREQKLSGGLFFVPTIKKSVGALGLPHFRAVVDSRFQSGICMFCNTFFLF